MSASVPLWRWRPFSIWWIVALISGMVGISLPLLESLGYELSLLASLVCALGAGHLAVLYPARARSLGRVSPHARVPIITLYKNALGIGLLLSAVPLAVSLANGLRVPFCNLSEGLAFYLLMPVLSVVIAVAMGLVVGLAVRRPAYATLSFVIIYLAGLFGALVSFHQTPAVYIFNPFFGYFPGVLYDRLVQVEPRLITYRITTLVQTAAILAVANLLFDKDTLRLTPKRIRIRAGSTLFAVGMLAAALLLQWSGAALGHRTTRSDLEEHLNQHVAADHLDLFFPESTSADRLARLTADAAFSLHQVQHFLGVAAQNRIAVFFFEDAADKAATIGAADTNVAKPWRNEVYVVLGDVPHMVLRHELVHAVTGPIGRPPFGIAGKWFGLLPNPGLIEGVAVAAQGPRGDLTVHQWASAMLTAELLPSVEPLFSLGFLGLSARRAYTAAGSFCQWMRDQFGTDALIAAYRSGDVQQATRTSFQALESGWRDYLETVPKTEADVASAAYRFDRPSVIGTACVHEVARLSARAQYLSQVGRHDLALPLFEAARRRSNGSTATKRAWFFALTDAGDTKAFRETAAQLLRDPAMGKVDRQIIREILADRDVQSGDSIAISKTYRRLAETAKSDGDRRRLEVKAYLTSRRPPGASALLGILSLRPAPEMTTPGRVALTVADAAAHAPNDPVLAYLHARQYFLVEDYDTALHHMDAIRRYRLETAAPSLGVALRMMRGQALFHLRRFYEARFQFVSIVNDESVRLGKRALAEDWADRARYFSTRSTPSVDVPLRESR